MGGHQRLSAPEPIVNTPPVIVGTSNFQKSRTTRLLIPKIKRALNVRNSLLKYHNKIHSRK